MWAIIAILLLIRTDGVSAEYGDHLQPEDSQLLLGYGRDDYEHVLWKYFSLRLHDGAERLRYRAPTSRETTALLRSLPR